MDCFFISSFSYQESGPSDFPVPCSCVFYDGFINLLVIPKLEYVVHIARDITNCGQFLGKVPILVQGGTEM